MKIAVIFYKTPEYLTNVVVPELPSNVGAHEDNTDTHNGEERLESDVVLEAGHGGALHGAGVVQLPASLTHKVGMVSSSEDPGQKHLENISSLNIWDSPSSSQ